jgi:hypothetical protein
MAGDWIPMRTNLEDDPTVIFISRATKLQPDHVVGKLHRLWAWIDSHTEDGSLRGIDAAWVDQYVKRRGFACAMSGAPDPWLKIDDAGISIPNFEHWFGTSAKRRLMDTRRKQIVRGLSAGCPQDERTKTVLQNRTEQKRRVLAPALGAVDWKEIRTKARKISDQLGVCGTQRNRRVLLCACVLAAELGDEWLDIAVRETCEAHAAKPYAYLQTILDRTSGDVDFKASIARIELPAKQSTCVSEVQHADS